MMRNRARALFHPGLVVLLALLPAVAAYAQSPLFSPPRLLTASVPPLPSPTVLGGGEVLIEVVIDRTGALTRPVIVRSTPPYTQMVLNSISGWRFEPARATDDKGVEQTVEAPVMIAAIYRLPAVYDNPVAGEASKNLAVPSADVAAPTAMATPVYPLFGPSFNLNGTVLLYEVRLGDAGQITQTRSVVSDPGFEVAGREALAKWRFRPASFRGRQVAASAYVLFGFRPPVVSSSR